MLAAGPEECSAETNMNSDVELPKLMVIDDDAGISEIIETLGRETGYDVTVVNDYELIRQQYRKVQPDYITLDLDLGVDEELEIAERGFDGLEFLQFLASQDCQAKIIIVSGSSKETRQVTAKIGKELNLDIIGSIGKPFKVSEFEKLLQKLRDRSLGGKSQ
jgi:CheY-like chemotaxis protein